MLFHILLNIPLKLSCCSPTIQTTLTLLVWKFTVRSQPGDGRKDHISWQNHKKTHFQKIPLWEQIVLALINSCAMLKQ